MKVLKKYMCFFKRHDFFFYFTMDKNVLPNNKHFKFINGEDSPAC